MYRIGVDIGGTNVAAGIVAEDFSIPCVMSVPFPKGQPSESIVGIIVSLVDALCGRAGIAPNELESVGIAVPGGIDQSGQVVIAAYNLDYFNFPLRMLLQNVLPVPVRLGNDANAAALAELCCGSLMGCTTAVLITLGTGVGGGLILGGKMFNGGRNMGVELGHMYLKAGGLHCTCGHDGCMECYCSATRLANQGKPYGLNDAKAVIDAAKGGDVRACAIFCEYVDDLGSAITSIVNLIDPERVAIGGGVVGAGEFLLEPLRENVRSKVFFGLSPDIVAAVMGNNAGIVGAAMLYRNDM
ncbi:MAG TPA: ROK family protein [Eubacteriales bacterium]|nr:ROK family protein [Clostridia bacterium]HRV72554.1 ROK family protein [Eubacteriales bacterium]